MQMGKYEKHIHCLKQKYQVNIGATTTKVKSRTLPVTFCLNKKKIPQGLRGKEYTNQFSLQSKGAVTVEDYWTECQCYDIV